MVTADESQDKRLDKLEERVNNDERELTALGTKVQLVNDSLKADIDKTNSDLRERLDDLKANIKIDHARINDTLVNLDDEIKSLNHSLQNLYITQKGDGTKVAMGEKIIWAIIGIIGTVGLAYMQEILKAGGAG